MATSKISTSTDILVAAETLFAEHGFDGVSIQRIATAAHVSKSNIYHHFSSKDALYFAVLKHACQDLQHIIIQLKDSSANPESRLAQFSQEHLRLIHKKSHVAKLILRELLDANSERGRELAQQVFSEQFSDIKTLLQQGQENGAIRQDMDAAHMATSLVALNIFLFQAWPVLEHLPGHAFQQPFTSGKTMFELLFHGLAKQPNRSGDNE